MNALATLLSSGTFGALAQINVYIRDYWVKRWIKLRHEEELLLIPALELTRNCKQNMFAK